MAQVPTNNHSQRETQLLETALAILRAFANRLNHPARQCLDVPFVHYVANQPRKAEKHFHGLREAKPDLVAFALFDRLDQGLPDNPQLQMYKWKRREIENYVCQRVTLLAYAETCAFEATAGPLFEGADIDRWRDAMEHSIRDFLPPAASRDPDDRWWWDTKISDEFLDRIFDAFYRRLGLPNLTRKTDYHVLAEVVPTELIDPEVSSVLDMIAETANRAKPRIEERPT